MLFRSQGYAGAQQALAPDDAGGTAPATTTPASTPAAAPTGGTSPAQTGGTGEIAANNLLARAKQGTTQDPAAQQTAPAAQTPAAQPADAAAQPAAQAPAQTAAADQQAKVGVGQINKIIPTLRTRDLQSVKKNVDATLAKKSAAKPAAPAAAPAVPAAAPAAEPEDDNPNIVRGYNMQENKVVKFKSRFLGMEI